MSVQERLLGMLADGELHSGSALAERLGVSRAAIWKQIQQLEELGLVISAAAGKGYRLQAPIEMFEVARLQAELDPAVRAGLESLELLWSVPSTSDYLLQSLAAGAGAPAAVIAEIQTGGRGRRGRAWLAPAGGAICLSLSWRFPVSPANLSCLGLAAGVGTLRALHACGVGGARLKWPNDIVLAGGKLAGLLIDVRGEAGGPLQVVVGAGVNFALNEATREAVVKSGGLRPACIADSNTQAGRNKIAAQLVTQLYRALEVFAAEGFAPFAAEWNESDALCGREVIVSDQGSATTGIARGIADDGRLRLEVEGRTQYFVTGDISLRPTD